QRFRYTVREAQFSRAKDIGKSADRVFILRCKVARADAATINASDRIAAPEEVIRQRNFVANTVDVTTIELPACQEVVTKRHIEAGEKFVGYVADVAAEAREILREQEVPTTGRINGVITIVVVIIVT